MAIAILVGLGILISIAIAAAILRKSKSTPPPALELNAIQVSDQIVVEQPAPQFPDRLVIGTNPDFPLVTIEAVAVTDEFQKATPLNAMSNNGISRLNSLFQAAPSLLVAGEASGKKLMEVVINGDLVRASDGNGLRAFTMNGKKISEHARLFEVENLQNMINAAAVWQLASVIVAQKHLADISRKLDEIKAGIQHISQFLNNQRKSRILATYDYLEQVHLSIKGGELPNSSRISLESCERDLLEIQNHLEMEYLQKIDKKIKHSETFGTEQLTNDVGQKISELEELTEDMAFCLKTRIAAWHVLSLFPGEAQLKVARRGSIQKSIESFSSLSPKFDSVLKDEIAAIDSFWNKGSTLEARKEALNNKRMNTAKIIESGAIKGSESFSKSELVLLENDQPTKLYIQFENDKLVEVRQAA